MSNINIGTTLVLLSGGVDSTYMLYKYLKDTNRALHVHHVALDRSVSNAKKIAEWRAVDNIVKYLREIRPFEFSYSEMNMPGYDGSTLHAFYAMVAATMVLAKGYGKVASGRLATDNTTTGWRNMHHALRVFDAAVDGRTNPPPEWVFPIDNLTKTDCIKGMPKELFALTWSCQHPKLKENGDIVECRKCIGCARRIEAQHRSGLFEDIPEEDLSILQEDDYTKHVEMSSYRFMAPLTNYRGRVI